MTYLREDVIADLLPLYFSGDASEATRAVVDAYFAAHPDFANTMRAAMANGVVIPGQPADNGGTRAILKIRSQLKWRAALIAAGIFCTISPLSFIVENDKLVYFMWRDAPGSAAIYSACAVLAWGALWVLTRRTNKL